MKKTFILLALLLFLVSTAFAMGTAPQVDVKIKTGDKVLDRALMDIDALIAKPAGVEEIMGILSRNFSVTKKEINSLRKRGYTLTEIYYLSLLAKQSKKNINSVAALRAKGVGWGVMAKKLGVRPADLNKTRVRLHKKTLSPKAKSAKPAKAGKGKKKEKEKKKD